MFELIKESVDIVRHVEKYTQLKQHGRYYQGLCPLHDDRTSPSFTVYPSDNSFYCFGCHKGGDVVDFEAERQQLSMGDAAKQLCEEYNLKPNYVQSAKYAQGIALKKKKADILDATVESLKGRQDIYEYIKKRGLTDETINEFSLGTGDKSNIVVIPIKDKFGKVVAFARRDLDPNAHAKYVNDSADLIFNKREILYGYDKAKYHIREVNSIILNEGYFDVMSLWESGIKSGVAFCSSRITREQVVLLQDLVDANHIIYFVPTNDTTAQNEFEKNITQVRAGFPKNHMRALIIPDDCKDLNDVLMIHGKEKITEIYQSSVPVELYLAKRIIKTEPIVEMQYTKIRNLCSSIDNALIMEDICNWLVDIWKKPASLIKSYIVNKNSQDEIVDTSKFKNMDMLMRDYELYIESLESNRLKFGWAKTDATTRGMRMGDVIQMIASTGVGKTMWAQNLMVNLVNQYPTLPIMFYSLEQTGVMAFERFAMMEGSLESKQVEGWYKNADKKIQEKLVETMRSFSKNYKNFVVVDESGIDMKKLEQYTLQAGMLTFGAPVKVVVIDYLGYLQGEGGDMYHKVSVISKQLKELAKKLNCIVISLHQVSKIGKTGGDPIEGYMARDSGVVQESADIMISAWRPELKEDLSDEEKKDLEGVYMTKIVKNRYGEVGRKIEFFFQKRYLKLLEKRDEPVMADEHGKIVAPPPPPPKNARINKYGG